jgi:hypothetical protein
VEQPDAAPLLAQVGHQAPFVLANAPERSFDLVATVAAERARGVPGQETRVHAHGYPALTHDVAVDDGQVVLGVTVVPEGEDAEVAEAGGYSAAATARTHRPHVAKPARSRQVSWSTMT